MQIEKMLDKHYKYLKEQFGIDKEKFDTICKEDGQELENLIDDLTWKECDAVDEYDELGHYTEIGLCAIELIDIICGPYDADEIESAMKEAENDQGSKVEMEDDVHIDGGPGSGNWGHVGRPGKKGGSASGGGAQNRTGTKESGYSSKAKYNKARMNKDYAHFYGTESPRKMVIGGMSFEVQKGEAFLYNSNDNKARKCTRYTSPEGIDFIAQNGVSKQRVEATVESFNQIPDYIRNQTQSTIILHNSPNYKDSYWKKVYGDPDFSSAMSSGYMQLNIYNTYDISEIKEPFFKQQVAHEIAHEIDRNLVADINLNHYCDTPRYRAAAAIDGNFTSRYAKSAHDSIGDYFVEDFAEGLSVYATGVDADYGDSISEIEFAQKFPERAKIFDSLKDRLR